MNNGKLYHISEDPKIKIFMPRLSPSHFDSVKTDVVFAISEKLLHNYLLPRDCPRVAFYATEKSSREDIEKLIGLSCADYVIAVENKWLSAIQMTTLFLYEMPVENFCLLDECAGYYISKQAIEPVSVKPVYNILGELMKRNIELRFMPSLQHLADTIKKSTLNFSMIRMKNSI
jgi:hypothetical protein